MSQSNFGETGLDRQPIDSMGPPVEPDESEESNSPRKYEQPTMVLHTAPSFSVYNNSLVGGYETEVEQGMIDMLERSVKFGENISSSEFCFSSSEKGGERSLQGIEESDESSSVFDGAIESSSPLYLAMGLGVEVCELQPHVDGVGGVGPSEGGFESEYKDGFEGAELQHSNDIQGELGDGEALSQYAKLIWERNHDRKTALCYFEKAIEAAPTNSNVLAAYASFLWEAGGDEEEERPLTSFPKAPLNNMTIASTNT